jgi:O-antigen/teichoic acid export membrane protein
MSVNKAIEADVLTKERPLEANSPQPRPLRQQAEKAEAGAGRYSELLQGHTVAKDLDRKSVRGGAATALSQATTFALRFGSTAILARLLTPNDYGLVAMTAVITGFVGVFKDAGLTSATVQRANITHEQVSMLFWINLLLGCSIAAILIALSPGVAAFYGEPKLAGITCVLSIPFVFGGLALQHQALLRRQMRFSLLAIIDIASFAAGVAIGILMAWLGYGYWSLAGMSIGTAAVNAAGVWLAMPWRPGRPRRGCGIKPLLKFGGDLLGFDIVHYFSCQTDNFLVGFFWGPAPLAFYQKGYTLMMQPLQQINSPLFAVVMPALSRLQNDPARLRRFFLGILQLIASVSLPLVLFIALSAREIVLIILGPAWLECVPLFRFLAPAAGLGAMMNPWGMLLVSLGQTRKYRITGIASAAVIVISFMIGVPFGARGVALAYSISVCLLVVPTWWYITKDTPITMGDVFRTWSPPLFAATTATIASFLISKMAMADVNHWVSALTGAGIFGGVYLLILLLGFGKWRFFLRILKELRGKQVDFRARTSK